MGFRRRQHQIHKPKFHLARHVTSGHDTTRSTCRARRDERVEPFCSTSSTSPNAWARHVERVVSCRGVTWRAKWNLGYTQNVQCKHVQARVILLNCRPYSSVLVTTGKLPVFILLSLKSSSGLVIDIIAYIAIITDRRASV